MHTLWTDARSPGEIYSILHLGDRRGLPCIVLDSRVGLVHLWSLALVLRFVDRVKGAELTCRPLSAVPEL